MSDSYQQREHWYQRPAMKAFMVTSLLTCPGLCWWAYSSQILGPPSDGNTECKRGWRQWWPGSRKGSRRSHFGLGSYNGPVGKNVWKCSGKGICRQQPIPIIITSHFTAIPHLNNIKQLEWGQRGHGKPTSLNITGPTILTRLGIYPTCRNVDDFLRLQ